ncbi:putative disease resistance RPP13-like protein 1 [Papaver somniferum]|uniref:putative disease resistance RPP13-like protein 1 n=1 Tax=Papaver somniferum TaxID=3469 RepID=UPI000E7034C8|nr:putative disease resistance RPP13-like protein 1 [Papaver somniferum]
MVFKKLLLITAKVKRERPRPPQGIASATKMIKAFKVQCVNEQKKFPHGIVLSQKYQCSCILRKASIELLKVSYQYKWDRKIDITISQVRGVKHDLRKLGKTLESIQALISDAEEKQLTDATVRLWLRRLKDVVYNADDVMDEFCYETMRLCERRSQIKHKVPDFISKSSDMLVFDFKMTGKIRALRKNLDEIYYDQVRYTLNVIGGTSQVDQIREQRNRLTTSVIDDSVLIGREDATLDIVRMLTDRTLPSISPSSSSSSYHSSQQEKLSVVSIVGMGGLGKTSLAQLVYQDKS